MPLTPTLAPGQGEVAKRLGELAAGAGSSGSGKVVFLAGMPGSGRSHLLRTVASSLPEAVPGARIVVGRAAGEPPNEGGGQEPTLPLDLVLTSAAASASALDPAYGMLGPLAGMGVAVHRVIEALRGSGERVESAELLARSLRTELAESGQGPLVCLVDNADGLGGAWWNSLRFPIGRQVVRDQPLVLVLAVDGESLSAEAGEGESAAHSVARSLIAVGAAEWHSLTALGENELTAWLGPAPRSLLKPALEISAGNAGTLAELWANWEARGVIGRDDDGGWVLNAPVGLLPDALDGLAARVEAMVGDSAQPRHEDLPMLLACAALEGRTFTARAVADVFEMDRNDVIDLFDELVDEEDPQRGVLRDVGALEIPDLTHDEAEMLWRFEFVHHLDWRAATSWLKDEERAGLAAVLVSALIEAYDPDIQMVAHVLAALSRTAGEEEAAVGFRRIAHRASRAALKGHVRFLLVADPVEWTGGDYRDAAERLLEASRELDDDPLTDLLAYADRATRYARGADAHSTTLEARALAEGADLLRRMGDPGKARPRLEAARQLVAEGAPETLALVLATLGELETHRDDDLEPGRRIFWEAVALFEGCGHVQGHAACLLRLGFLEMTAENYDAAREVIERAAKLAAEIGDADLEMTAMHQRGTVESLAGDSDIARSCALSALEYMRRERHTDQEAHCICLLANIDYNCGEFRAAWDHAGEALKIQRRLGDEVGEATTLLVLGKAALGLDRTDIARNCLTQSASLFDTHGCIRKAAEVRAVLGWDLDEYPSTP